MMMMMMMRLCVCVCVETDSDVFDGWVLTDLKILGKEMCEQDRQTDRQTERQRDREMDQWINLFVFLLARIEWQELSGVRGEG